MKRPLPTNLGRFITPDQLMEFAWTVRAPAVGIGTFVKAFVPNSGGSQAGKLAARAGVILVPAAFAIVGPWRVLAKTDLAMLARTES